MPGPDGELDSIADVLAALDAVVARAVEERSRVGYFAAIYRKVTAKIAEGIATGLFDDGARMERFDIAFADRYLAAIDGYRAGRTVTKSWEVAFDAADASRPLVMQHLLLGINAHVNLDLGIAAAETAPGDRLPSLRRDFDRVNEIIASLMAEVRHDIATISPWIGLLDAIGGRHDDEIIRFSMEIARAEAWRFAVELAPLGRDVWSGPIGVRDARVGRLAKGVLTPGLLTAGLLIIRARESNDVRRNIEVLARVPGPDLRLVEARVRQDRASTP
jgi:hypothetical protein